MRGGGEGEGDTDRKSRLTYINHSALGLTEERGSMLPQPPHPEYQGSRADPFLCPMQTGDTKLKAAYKS